MKRKYEGKVKVLVTIRVKDNPTAPSDTAHWAVDESERRLSKRVAVAFVQDAVASWGGQAPPDYVFFPNNISVTARRAK